jgi:hypothetical protein
MVKKKSVMRRSRAPYPNDKRTIWKGWHAVPLKSSFMFTAILGFFVSAYWVFPQSYNFGIAFMLIFVMMFIASLISMTKAPIKI